jgi:hypothetical protein
MKAQEPRVSAISPWAGQANVKRHHEVTKMKFACWLLVVAIASLSLAIPAWSRALFSGAIDSPAGPFPRALAAGDFDGDRLLDLAVTNHNNSDSDKVNILLGVGTGVFQDPIHYRVGTSPYAVAVADFNNDIQPSWPIPGSSFYGQSLCSIIAPGWSSYGVSFHTVPQPMKPEKWTTARCDQHFFPSGVRFVDHFQTICSKLGD